MDKVQIIDYIKNNYEIPQNISIDYSDISFCFEILNYDGFFINNMPIDIIEKIIIQDYSYLFHLSNEKLDIIFNDRSFVLNLVNIKFDALSKLRNLDINSELLKNILISYIKGEYSIPENSKIIRNKKTLFLYAIKSVQEDYDLCMYLINEDIKFLPYIKNEQIRNNKEFIYKYLLTTPSSFKEYSSVLDDILNDELLEKIIKNKFDNYKFLNPNNEYMMKFYDKFEYLKKIKPGLTLDNPNLRCELLLDDYITSLNPCILKSILQYNNDSIDRLIKENENGNLEYLVRYIELYNKLFDNTLENIQYAIKSFDTMRDLFINICNSNIEIEEDKLKNIILNNNIFNINTLDDLKSYDTFVSSYYMNMISSSNTIEDIKNICTKMLFNCLYDEFLQFYKDYLNNDIISFEKYCIENNAITFNIEELKNRISIFNAINNITNINKLKEVGNQMPLTVLNINDVKSKIAESYSITYNNSFLDVNNVSSSIYKDGVKILNLEGQDFKLLIHRIFNFNFNMDALTQQLINEPKKWNELEGATTISATLISDKKIAGVFSELKTSSSSGWIGLETPEALDLNQKNKLEYESKILNGEILKEIDPTAVFYGFTEILPSSLIKVKPSDMMVEHGKGKLNIKSSNCYMMSPDDLAYWTSLTSWNEVALKRNITSLDEARDYIDRFGNDRLQPTCIVCFDNVINEESMLTARTFDIPIVNIDRKKYLQKNNDEIKDNITGFGNTYDSALIKKMFYSLSYEKLVNFIPLLIDSINNNNMLEETKKSELYNVIQSQIQYFINHSVDGYILNIPISDYNNKMVGFLEQINTFLKGIAIGDNSFTEYQSMI